MQVTRYEYERCMSKAVSSEADVMIARELMTPNISRLQLTNLSVS